MTHKISRLIAVVALLAAGSQAQKLAIVGCTSTAALSGHDCTKAYDGSTGTDWEGRSSPMNLTLDLGAVKGIKRVVFDRGGYLYHGRIKAFADAVREQGLSF